MPKFGLKCFLGSFILSLAAVVGATKAYLYLVAEPAEEQKTDTVVEARSIELFAVNDEKDVILEKYEQRAAKEQAENVAEDAADEMTEGEFAADASKFSADVLFAPEEADVSSDEALAQNDDNDTGLMESEQVAETSSSTAESEFKIVDAAEATMFEIPLTHGFSSSKEDVTVAQRATTNQVALADDNMPIENLGVDSKKASAAAQVPSLDEVDDDPWEVAEVANKNITRNQNAETVNKPVTGNSVPYKMQKNILIPIPDEIANDKNLTPQFSSSAENIKLEEELRRKHGRAPIENSSEEQMLQKNIIIENKISQEGTAEEKAESSAEEKEISGTDEGSLTDSIAAWFSSGRKKSADDKNDNNMNTKDKITPSGKQESSLFRRLLGLGTTSKDNISPTELKLSFQANRAEISGQTLEWIKAFSENVVNYDDVAIEIRLDRSASYELQQKRLKLLYKILANNGVEYRKINIIFTDREPNSFIIRNVRYVTKEEKAEVAAKGKSPWY